MRLIPSPRFSARTLALLASLACARPARAADAPFTARAAHVVLIVWDGMRPDFIRAATTPTLHALAERGTFFANNHSVYVTSTEVNGAAIATGCYPARTGIVANIEYRPDIQLTRPIGTESFVGGQKPTSKGDIVSRPSGRQVTLTPTFLHMCICM